MEEKKKHERRGRGSLFGQQQKVLPYDGRGLGTWPYLTLCTQIRNCARREREGQVTFWLWARGLGFDHWTLGGVEAEAVHVLYT